MATWRVGTLLCLVGLSALACGVMEPRDVLKVRGEILSRQGKLKSFSVRTHSVTERGYRMKNPPKEDVFYMGEYVETADTSDEIGSVDYVRDDGTVLFRRASTSVRSVGGESYDTSYLVVVCDGTTRYQKSRMGGNGKVFTSPSDGKDEAKAFFDQFGALSLGLHDKKPQGAKASTKWYCGGFPIRCLPDETVRGRAAYVLEMLDEAVNGFESARIYYDQETGIPLRWEVLDRKGQFIWWRDVTELEVNPELPRERFLPPRP